MILRKNLAPAIKPSGGYVGRRRATANAAVLRWPTEAPRSMSIRTWTFGMAGLVEGKASGKMPADAGQTFFRLSTAVFSVVMLTRKN